MLLKSFLQTRKLKLSYVQFALGIVLDSLNYLTIGNTIISMGHDETDISYNLIRDLETQFENSNTLVNDFITYIYQNPIIPYTKTGRTTKTTELKSLSQIVTSYVTKDKLVQQVTELLISTPLENLIVRYCYTASFKKAFSAKVQFDLRKSADGYRDNYFDDAIITNLLVMFANFVNMNSKSRYDISSRTPTDFLMHTYNNYFSKGKGNDIHELLSERATGANIGGDDSSWTRADLLTVKDKSVKSINFIELASKINASSNSLFCHANEKVAYYDIFSYYRDSKFEKEYNEKIKNSTQNPFKHLSGISITNQSPKDIISDGTKQQKYNARIEMCDVYADILCNRVSIDQLYNLYNRCLQLSAMQASKTSGSGSRGTDGVTYYESGGFRVKSGSNAERFQTDVEGFLALKELISYLESVDIDIYKIPPDIFRNRLLLRRFHSLEDYISMLPAVKELMEESRSDSSRTFQVDELGLYNNDSIYECINHVGPGEVRLDSLQDITLNSITDAIQEREQRIQRENAVPSLASKISAQIKRYEISKGFNQQCSKIMFPSTKEEDTFVNRVILLNTYLTQENMQESLEQNPYLSPAIFATLLEYFMIADNKSLYNADNKFVLYENFTDSLGLQWKLENESIYNIIISGLTLIGNKASTFINGHDMQDWTDILSICCAGQIILQLNSNLNQFILELDKLYNTPKNNKFFVCMKVAHDSILPSLPESIVELNDLRPFLSGVKWQGILDRNIFSRTEIKDIHSIMKSKLVTFVNRYLSFRSEELQLLAYLKEDIHITIKLGTTKVSSISNKDYKRLITACMSELIIKDSTSAAHKIQAIFDFNEYGLAMYHNELFRFTDNIFVHRKGYFLTVPKDAIMDVRIEEIELQDLDQIERRIQIVYGG